MLRSMRDGAKSGIMKFILLGFMALAVGGLVLTDVGGFFRGGVSNNMVAKGSGIEISTVSFDQTVRRVLARQGMLPQEAYRLGLIDQILQNEIQVRILAKEAAKTGIRVGDETVTKKISELAEPLVNGSNTKKEALQQILRSQGISESEFINSIRQEMGNGLYRDAILSGASGISKAQAAALYQYNNETRVFEGFILTNDSIKDVEKPSEENLQKYYEANKSDFAIAETRDVTIATLNKEMVKDQVTISDEELRKQYDDTIDTYKRPERRTVEQAIVASQTDAQDILAKVNKGKSLKTSVKDVTGKEGPYLGENAFEKDGLLEDVSNKVFTADKGAKIGPIQTALGWHVIVLKDIIEPQTESFDSVKKNIEENMLLDRLAEDLVDAANALDDQLAGGEKLETVVAEMGLTTQEFKGFNQAGYDSKNKDLFESYEGDKAQILEAAFDYEAGEASPVLELNDGRYVTVRVDNVKPLSYESFESKRVALEKRWMNEQRMLSNRARAADALQELNNNAELAKVAKDYGGIIKNYKNLKRADAAKPPFPPLAKVNIFDAKEGQNLKLSIQDGFMIGQVKDIQLPNTANAEEEIAKVQEQSGQAMPQEILSQYINSLSEKYKVKINTRVLDTIYGAPTEG